MAKADPSIDPRILSSAREEFLALGFKRSSLHSICAGARVTTGALYKRYRSKEDLFRAVVAQTVDDLLAVAREKTSADLSALSDETLIRAWEMDEDYMMWWFHFLYDRHDGFVLLLRCAEGTQYANFQHDWVEVMTQGTWNYYQEALRRGLTQAELTHTDLHILLTAFWTTIYEPFIHGYDWSQIQAHCQRVCRLFNWYEVFGFPSHGT